MGREANHSFVVLGEPLKRWSATRITREEHHTSPDHARSELEGLVRPDIDSLGLVRIAACNQMSSEYPGKSLSS